MLKLPSPSALYRPSLRVIQLEKENHQLRKQVIKIQKESEEKMAHLEQIIQDLQIQLAEFKAMIFRTRKPKKNDEDHNEYDESNKGTSNHMPRSKDSYRRQQPKKEDVTKEENYSLDQCTRCNGSLEEIETRTIYLEDIPEITKEVTKQLIHLYICLDCNKKQSKIPIPQGHDIKLGPRVRSYVLYYTYILNASYRDIIRSLWDYYHIEISKGEIQNIQEEAARKLKSTYNGIQEELLEQESINSDETSWKIKGVLNYLWGLCSPTTDAVLFFVGSRGKGVIESLLKDFSGCLTTDCYGAYKRLAHIVHQVCWVHILRNAKDLCHVSWLSDVQRQSAKDFHQGLLGIYHSLKQARDAPFDVSVRKKTQASLIKRLKQINKLLPCDTPKKLKNIKLLTQEYEQELFTCLQFKTALPENNLAERNLRHVVLKRRRSFGSRSEKGARTFAVNCSVLLTLRNRFPRTFLVELAGALKG